jgi:MarR family transcriptional regulator, temperature-dependent positive regulator of motility
MAVTGHVGVLLRRAQQRHNVLWSTLVSRETTSVQYGLLEQLAAHDALSQVELGSLLDLDRSTVADVVARLERRGLVARARDEVDRRRNVLGLTEHGLAVQHTLRDRVGVLDRTLLGPFEPDAAEELLDRLAMVAVAGAETEAS